MVEQYTEKETGTVLDHYNCKIICPIMYLGTNFLKSSPAESETDLS
jgi:hypothetical protein